MKPILITYSTVYLSTTNLYTLQATYGWRKKKLEYMNKTVFHYTGGEISSLEQGPIVPKSIQY